MKPKIVFQLDSGWFNGPVNAQDAVGIDAAIAAMQTYDGTKVDVYAGMNLCTNSDDQIVAVLDRFKGRMGFFLDVGSSDVLAMRKRAWACPANMQHGMVMSLGRLDWINKRYRGWLGGIRFHEMLTQSEILSGYLGDDWQAGYAGEVPTTPFFQPDECWPLIEYAHGNSLVVELSEPSLLAQGSRDPRRPAWEQLIRDWQNQWSATVIPTWANNLAGEPARHQYWNWLKTLFTNNTLGWGLSNQPLWNDSVKDPVGWAVEWAESGGMLLHNEPAWGMFKFPVGTFTDFTGLNYPSDPAWADRGSPLPVFLTLRDTLMKSIKAA